MTQDNNERMSLPGDPLTLAVLDGLAGLVMKNDQGALGIDIIKTIHRIAVYQLVTGKEYSVTIKPRIEANILRGFIVEEVGERDLVLSIEKLWESIRMTALAHMIQKQEQKSVFDLLKNAMPLRTIEVPCDCPACTAEREAGRNPTTH